MAGKYAIPAYIERERYGVAWAGGQYQTPPRRRPPSKFWSGYAPTSGDETTGLRPSINDPIGQFGVKAARIIMTQTATLPGQDRVRAIEEILRAWDGALPETVAEKAKKLGLEKAIAASLSNSFAEKIVAAGSMGALGDDCDGPCALNRLGLSGFFDAIGSAVKSVGRTIGKVVVGTGKAIGNLACKTVGVAGPIAGTLLGGPAGAAAGTAGAQIVGTKLCGQPGGSAGDIAAQTAASYLIASGKQDLVGGGTIIERGPPAWVTPALVGAGALVVVLLVTRK